MSRFRKSYLIYIFAIFTGGSFFSCSEGEENEQGLIIFCAASFREPMEKIIAQYQVKEGVRVVVNYGGSGGLSAQLQIVDADVFLPADISFFEPLLERDLIENPGHLFFMPVSFVCLARKEGVQGSFAHDMLNTKFKFSLGDRTTAIGVYVDAQMERLGLVEDFRRQLVSEKPTVTGALNDVLLSAADASFVWSPLVENKNGLNAISIKDFGPGANVAIAVSRNSKDPQQAKRFVHFVKNEGLKVFYENGFMKYD